MPTELFSTGETLELIGYEWCLPPALLEEMDLVSIQSSAGTLVLVAHYRNHTKSCHESRYVKPFELRQKP